MSTIEAAVLQRPRFVTSVRNAALMTLLSDLPAVVPERVPDEPEWSFALLCASAVTASPSEDAQRAILHLVHACLTSTDSSAAHKEAARLLLIRLGNGPSVALGERLGLFPPAGSVTVPLTLAMDAELRADRLVIRTNNEEITGNDFQNDFWDAVSSHQWVSVSAPTSAGKSHIVRRWIRDRYNSNPAQFKAAYIAPTRALVEEVSRLLKDDLPGVPVITLPWDPLAGLTTPAMYVLTQERLHLLQQRFKSFAPELIFIDEAHNAANGARGILLSRVIDEASTRAPAGQVIFASPMASNPSFLVESAPPGVSSTGLSGHTITVSQNLLYAEQVSRKPTTYNLSRVLGDDVSHVGTFNLPARTPKGPQRLPYVAVALGRARGGNVVYANTAKAAETTALQIYDLLGETADSDDPQVRSAVEYVRGSVHERYSLAQVLKRGVAFHYGNMPLQVKARIETLFREGKIDFLVCTSTLLEGVNLPCRNIFMQGPRKGVGNPMTAADFWNLAGRAGRWGTEFQGNVICVDVSNDRLWPTKPARRTTSALRRAADLTEETAQALYAYIDSGASVPDSTTPADAEALFSLLASSVANSRPIDTFRGMSAFIDVRELTVKIESSLAKVEIPGSLTARHAGISPVSMQHLLNALREDADPEDQSLVLPESNQAVSAYKDVLDAVGATLGGPFPSEARRWQLARLIVNWMRGVPLSKLIDGRVNNLREQGRPVNLASEIRAVMKDVEEIARFQAPKFLACYADIVALHHGEIGIGGDDQLPDITMMLELGVPRVTDMSLMNLGLSRAATLAVAPFLTSDALSPTEALLWLETQDVTILGLPTFAEQEVIALLEERSAREVGETNGVEETEDQP